MSDLHIVRILTLLLGMALLRCQGLCGFASPGVRLVVMLRQKNMKLISTHCALLDLRIVYKYKYIYIYIIYTISTHTYIYIIYMFIHIISIMTIRIAISYNPKYFHNSICLEKISKTQITNRGFTFLRPQNSRGATGFGDIGHHSTPPKKPVGEEA